MASIRRRKRAGLADDGRRSVYSYAVLYRDREGRQRSETFTRLRDAERRKSEVEVELRAGSYIAPSASRLTFGQWFEQWAAARRVSPARAATDRSRARHVLERWERVPLRV